MQTILDEFEFLPEQTTDFEVSSGSFCQIYKVTDEAFIAETAGWPNFFLMNVFFIIRCQ